MGQGGNIVTDIPRYRVYENGVFTKELTDASAYWKAGYVGFLIGCSFSFEEALMAAGLPVRHIEQGCNVPMYKTNIQTVKAGPFEGPMVCSMRPMTPEQAKVAYDITVKMPNVHGAPVQIGDPEKGGVKDVMKPDYGDPVEIREGEIPVFWPCGVTPQAAVENAKPPVVITHAPGHMFITDILNTELNDYPVSYTHLDLLLFFQPGPAKAADPSAAPLPDSVPMVLLPAAQSAQAACPLLLAVLQRGTQPPVWGICRGPLLLISRSGSLWSKETAALEKFF